MSDVTRILSAIEQGDQKASEQLLPLVYEELRKLATAKPANENSGQTLQATALFKSPNVGFEKDSDNWTDIISTRDGSFKVEDRLS